MLAIQRGVILDPDGHAPISNGSITRQLSDRQKGERKRLNNRSMKSKALLLAGGSWTPHDLRRNGRYLMVALGVAEVAGTMPSNHIKEKQGKSASTSDSYEPENARGMEKGLGQRLDILVNQDETK